MCFNGGAGAALVTFANVQTCSLVQSPGFDAHRPRIASHRPIQGGEPKKENFQVPRSLDWSDGSRCSDGPTAGEPLSTGLLI